MNQLESKTALITGGTAGIGRACAEAMSAAGAEAVVINGRNRERGERALAVEGKRHDIRANVLTPSIVGGTEFYQRLMADPFAGRLFGKAEQRAELGLVNMTDLAEIAVFPPSLAASKMTGQALSVTGGISAL
jgi:NAD(P)-dependent dehydrogenase (short-subunit alcohol dehydrogenase family)